MYKRLRGHMVTPDTKSREPIFDLFLAVIKLARRDVEMPTHRGPGNSVRLPSAQEQQDAREFLHWCRGLD